MSERALNKCIIVVALAVLAVSAHQLWAAPDPVDTTCTNRCQEKTKFAYRNPNNLETFSCLAYVYPACNLCVNSGGCFDFVGPSLPTCAVTLQPQAFQAATDCGLPCSAIYYEDQMFEVECTPQGDVSWLGFVHICTS